LHTYYDSIYNIQSHLAQSHPTLPTTAILPNDVLSTINKQVKLGSWQMDLKLCSCHQCMGCINIVSQQDQSIQRPVINSIYTRNKIGKTNNNTTPRMRFPPHWKLMLSYGIHGCVCFTINRPHKSYQSIRRITLTDELLTISTNTTNNNNNHQSQPDPFNITNIISLFTQFDRNHHWMTTVGCYDRECLQQNKQKPTNSTTVSNNDIRYDLNNFVYAEYK
jgi:hypothetical protein